MATTSPYPMPLPTADLATTWAFLEEGVDHIMTRPQTGVSHAKYMSLYTVVYNYCTTSKMPSSSGEESAARRCPLLFIVLWPMANIPFSWCQSDGL
jgi:cullin 1